MEYNRFIEAGDLLKGLGISPIDLSSLGAGINLGVLTLPPELQNHLKLPTSNNPDRARIALSPRERPSQTKQGQNQQQIGQRSYSTNRLPQTASTPNIFAKNTPPAYIPMVQQKPDPSFVSPAVTGKYQQAGGGSKNRNQIFGEINNLPNYQNQNHKHKNSLNSKDDMWKGTPFDSPKQQSQKPQISFGQLYQATTTTNSNNNYQVPLSQQQFTPQQPIPRTNPVGIPITSGIPQKNTITNNFFATKPTPPSSGTTSEMNPEVAKILEEIKRKNQLNLPSTNATTVAAAPANTSSPSTPMNYTNALKTNNNPSAPYVASNLNQIPAYIPSTSTGITYADKYTTNKNLVIPTATTNLPISINPVTPAVGTGIPQSAASNTTTSPYVRFPSPTKINTQQPAPYTYVPMTNYKITPPVLNVIPTKKEMSPQKRQPVIIPNQSMQLLQSSMMKSISPFAPNESQKKKARLNEKYLRIVDECKRTKQLFTDYEFPANEKSIAKPENLNQYRQIKRWVRPKEIWPNCDFELYYKIIEPNDVQQGNLADCAFLSALAALAETPQRIQRIFVNSTKSEFGVYSVNIVWRGIPVEVVVDDYIPVDPRDKPFFQQSKEKELWAFVLEKAWAKLHGNYDQLSGMLTKEALHDLTGAALRNFDPQHCDEQAVWKRLLQAKANGNNWIIAAGTRGEDTGDDSDPLKKDGLISGHAYTVLSVYEIDIQTPPYGKKVKERLVKLRNPWGSFEWNKTFSDNDKNWDLVTQSTQLRIDFKQEDDGTFFMRWDTFREYFDSLDICYYYDDFEYFGVRCRTRFDSGQFFKVEIKKESECFFFVSQISIRLFDETYQFERPAEKGHYSEALYVIADAQGNLLQRIKGKKRDLFSPKYLDNEQRPKFKPGTYYAYVHVNWQRNATHSFGFGVYTKQAEIKAIMPFEATPIVQQAKKWQAGPTFDLEFESVYGRV